MKPLSEFLPLADTLLTFEPEEIGSLLLEFFNQRPQGSFIHRYNFLAHEPEVLAYCAGSREVKAVLAEGFNWLEQSGLIGLVADDSSQHNFSVTRRGLKLKSAASVAAFKLGRLLSTGNLDVELAEKVIHLFTRGDYDTAIFQAYKIVEVRVRDLASFSEATYGTDLMREAFNPARGPLSDPGRPRAEREATAHLFAGAIGLFKNPSSHRNVRSVPEATAELIYFANYLLRLLDRLRQLGAPFGKAT